MCVSVHVMCVPVWQGKKGGREKERETHLCFFDQCL